MTNAEALRYCYERMVMTSTLEGDTEETRRWKEHWRYASRIVRQYGNDADWQESALEYASRGGY